MTICQSNYPSRITLGRNVFNIYFLCILFQETTGEYISSKLRSKSRDPGENPKIDYERDGGNSQDIGEVKPEDKVSAGNKLNKLQWGRTSKRNQRDGFRGKDETGKY